MRISKRAGDPIHTEGQVTENTVMKSSWLVGCCDRLVLPDAESVIGNDVFLGAPR